MEAPAFPIAVFGARGYAGQILHALLMQHPRMRPVVVDAREPDDEALALCADTAACALALPDDAAELWTDALTARGLRVLDLSSAHRVTAGVHYGIPELFGPPPSECRLVSNPGCYPTAALLALAPLVRGGLVDRQGVSVVGCSGTSGAGKALRDDLHFSELYGNLLPYKVGEHKHLGEMERHLGVPVSFVSQLVPIVRGLLVTAFVRTDHRPEELRACLQAAYADHPWITVAAKPDVALGVRHVLGTHQAVIGVGPVAHGNQVPVLCAIDNLMRGAASQAVANLNLWLGLPVELGLPAPMTQAPEGMPGMTRCLP